MGDTGPCGPCSEIHIDIRDESEKQKISGCELVNKDHPEVIEIWNLVFIEFNRKSDGSLKTFLQNMWIQEWDSNAYAWFYRVKNRIMIPIIFSMLFSICKIIGCEIWEELKTDIAMRVIADHLRAVVFSIADGQFPSNVKAGYVIRRILRRAVRYGYTFLNMQDPFMFELVPSLVEKMGDVFPEIKKQQELIRKVIMEEEISFLRTLASGIKKFETYIAANPDKKIVDGKFAFELFDTFGFPVDLTRIMAEEKGWNVDLDGFNKGLEQQKERSRSAAAKDMEDWVIVDKDQ